MLSNVWYTLKTAVSDFIEDDALTQAGALSFYAALALSPLLLIFTTVAGWLGDGFQSGIVRTIETIIGSDAGQAISDIIDNAQGQASLGTIAGIAGFATLLFSASGVFASLQASLNHMWDVQAKPGGGLWAWLRKRVLGLGMVFVILFLLILALIASSFLSAVVASPTDIGTALKSTVDPSASPAVPAGGGTAASGGEGSGLGNVNEESSGASDVIWMVVQYAVLLVVFFGLFVAMFKFLPDVKIGWRDVIYGAAATAVLFLLGKWAIGLYLGKAAPGSAYGAAGSLIVLLLWVYYSSLILFFGAELTQAYVKSTGRTIEPDEHAIPEQPKQKTPAHGKPSGAQVQGT
jgi:membrane protein